ncbi:MAG TPA: SDR family NAD(P)-dependent oxidoreductase [Myxococcales bacterium]|jgi:NAD(P)-dependent dehydrogenase (short-subunit alcohol dehydrogenase family)
MDAPRPAALDGRICLVTGATSGIGQATAEGLARLGGTVVLAGRSAAAAKLWAASEELTGLRREGLQAGCPASPLPRTWRCCDRPR